MKRPLDDYLDGTRAPGTVDRAATSDQRSAVGFGEARGLGRRSAIRAKSPERDRCRRQRRGIGGRGCLHTRSNVSSHIGNRERDQE